MELTVGRPAKPGSPQFHLPTQLKDVSVSTTSGALSALEALCDYALYKSTFTLHYNVHCYVTLCYDADINLHQKQRHKTNKLR